MRVAATSATPRERRRERFIRGTENNLYHRDPSDCSAFFVGHSPFLPLHRRRNGVRTVGDLLCEPSQEVGPQ